MKIKMKKMISLNSVWVLAAIILAIVFASTNCQEKVPSKSSGQPDDSSGSKLTAESHHHKEMAINKTNISSSPEKTKTFSPQGKAVIFQGKDTTKNEKKLYHCPMHPNYISNKPGECPICGMDLVLIEEEKKEEKVTLPGGTVEISPEKQQFLGVTFGQVAQRELHHLISAYGRLTYDETRLASVTTKFSGWIEKLFINYTGKLVKRGEPLFSIYSPDLVAAQEEYLLAIRAQKTFGPIPSDKGWADLIEASRRRLLLLDINQEQMEKIEKEAKPLRTLTVYSSVTGFVIEKNVVEGKFIMGGENLLSLADLSRLWLLADIYEQDIPFISLGQKVNLEIASFPNENLQGHISYIYPYLEKESRTIKVRVELPNPEYKFKPELYGRLKIHLILGRRLSIPEEAVIDTGERKVVFVVHEGRYFEPREIKLGLKAGDFYEVLSDLEEGEQVVTSAQFLIDSESRLKSAIQSFHQPSQEKKPERKEEKTSPSLSKHIH